MARCIPYRVSLLLLRRKAGHRPWHTVILILISWRLDSFLSDPLRQVGAPLMSMTRDEHAGS